MTINVRAMPDVEATFWRSDVDVTALHNTHRKPGAIDLMYDLAMIDPDDTLYLDQFVLMSGRFLPLLSNETNYCFTFSPGLGDDPAIVFPVYADGSMVDLLAICAHDTALWACVTGRGGMSGNFAAGQPVRVYKEPWRWLLFGCDGVVVLNKNAYSPRPFTVGPDGTVTYLSPKPSMLTDASVIVAKSLDHADDLVYLLFERPIIEHHHPSISDKLAFEWSGRNMLLGQSRVVIDPERTDIEAELLSRAVEETLVTMKTERLFE